MSRYRCFFILFFIIRFEINSGETIFAASHPCQRQCEPNEPARICFYVFRMELYYTLSKACHRCPFNQSDCHLPHCIAANGVEKSVIVVNRQLPGPSIQVCEGDTVIVDVHNMMFSESTSIHWHGMHQKRTPYMDGVSMITQCPIPPFSVFRYTFDAVQSGTHFWHSHTGLQNADGVFGTFIVRQTADRDPHAALYDEDLPQHAFIVVDWPNVSATEKFAAHHHSRGNNKAESFLINGKGRHREFKTDGEEEIFTPVEVFDVTRGKRYRFRVVSNGVLNCPFELSVENHTMQVIASDGHPVEPMLVDSLVVYSGERFDFILTVNQSVDNYWILVRGLLDCGERFTNAYQLAILRYEGAEERDPVTKVDLNSSNHFQVQLNSLNKPSTNSTVSVADLNSLIDDDWPSDAQPTHQFHLAFDFNAVDNKHFHNERFYPFDDPNLDKIERIFTPQINHISLSMPSSPLLSQHFNFPFCNETTIKKNCSTHYCECLYVLQIPLNSLVELILIDNGYVYDANHPFHLHGHAFRVVAMDRIGQQVSTEQVKNLDASGLIRRKTSRAPLKDTITVPDGGYVVLRFLANNPGYWLLHCHISFHMETGMAVIFKIGTHQQLPPVPKGFPQCKNWLPKYGVEESTNTAIGLSVSLLNLWLAFHISFFTSCSA